MDERKCQNNRGAMYYFLQSSWNYTFTLKQNSLSLNNKIIEIIEIIGTYWCTFVSEMYFNKDWNCHKSMKAETLQR